MQIKLKEITDIKKYLTEEAKDGIFYVHLRECDDVLILHKAILSQDEPGVIYYGGGDALHCKLKDVYGTYSPFMKQDKE